MYQDVIVKFRQYADKMETAHSGADPHFALQKSYLLNR